DRDVDAEFVRDLPPPVEGDVALLADACRRKADTEPIAAVHGGDHDAALVDRVARVAWAVGKPLIIPNPGLAAVNIGGLAPEALLQGAVVVLVGPPAADAAERLRRFDIAVCAVRTPRLSASHINLPTLTATQRLAEWRAALGPAEPQIDLHSVAA